MHTPKLYGLKNSASGISFCEFLSFCTTAVLDMVVIRLKRVGVKNNPRYRVSVADSRRSALGKSIEILGHYNPLSKDKKPVVNRDRYNYWLQHGAKPSLAVKSLLNKIEKRGK